MLSVIDCSRNHPCGHIEVASIAGLYATFERVSIEEPMVELLARMGHPPRISNRTRPKGFDRGAGGPRHDRIQPQKGVDPRAGVRNRPLAQDEKNLLTGGCLQPHHSWPRQYKSF
jgi:hypothetical protein